MNVFVKKEKPALCAQCLVLTPIGYRYSAECYGEDNFLSSKQNLFRSLVLRQMVWIFQCAPRDNRVEMSLSVA